LILVVVVVVVIGFVNSLAYNILLITFIGLKREKIGEKSNRQKRLKKLPTKKVSLDEWKKSQKGSSTL